MNKQLFFLILLLSCLQSYVNAQAERKILQVGAGEYLTVYRTNDGAVFMTTRGSNNRYQITRLPVKDIIDVEGAQYTVVALDSAGAVFILGIDQNGQSYTKPVPVDAAQNKFTGNTKVYGWYMSYLTLRDQQIFMWGADLLNVNEGKNIDAPIRLQLPPGKKIRKLVPLTLGEASLMALATDGTVWIYSKGRRAPVKVILPSPAINIAGVGAACYVVETKKDLLAWGYLGSYLGVQNFSTKPVSIRKKWTSAGCIFPSKELVGNYNTLHIIDANDNMFGAGENVQGEVGNGQQFSDWKNHTPPYAWSWKHAEMITAPVQIMGKFKNLCTSNSITFYHYVQDMGDNWYSWGRNKARSLGNGVTLSVNEEALYPDAINVPAPTLVTPLNTKWKILEKINNAYVPLPLANAGVNQYTKAGSSTLYGNASSQQAGSIKKYEWTQVSGEPVKIVSPNNAVTKITDIKFGECVFMLKVFNDKDLSDTAIVTVTRLQ